MLGNQTGQEAAGALIGAERACRPPSLTERLTGERDRLRERLAEVERVLASLERNPEAKDLLDNIARLGHIGF